MTRKRTLSQITLGLALLLGMMVVPSRMVRALDHDRDCRARIERQEQKLHEAIRRHGERSRQAEKARMKLHQIRENCHM